ncbi:MAG: carboxypeptidase-like regulatory domain-containing protein [Gemmatimonadota bacterium]
MFAATATVLLAAVVGVVPADAQQTRVITGVVIDAQSSMPVADALVRIQGSELQAVTTVDGAFRITAGVGRHILIVEHIAYGNHADTVVVRGDQDTRLQIRISPQAIQLTPVLVEVETELELRRRTSGRSFTELQRAQIDVAAQKGQNLAELLRDGLIGVKVGNERGGSVCVEYRQGGLGMGSPGARASCKPLAVFVDGVRIGASSIYSTMPLRDLERIEVQGPAEAGTRYGIAGGNGVLLIETRQGMLARRRPESKTAQMTTLDWSLEAQPYRWARVASSSVIGNAVGLGLSLLVADQCLRLDAGINGLRSKCDAFSTVGSGFILLGLPGVSGSLAASWAGTTERSKGRVLPSALLGTLSAASGYLLLVQGEGNNSQAARTAGILMLTVATPILTTAADRVFRSLR